MPRLLSYYALPCVAAGLAFAAATQAADLFDRHTTHWLKQAVGDQTGLAELSQQQAGKLKLLGAGIDQPCVIIKTDEENWAKALLTWGFRKGAEKPVPVLLIERFVTYQGERANQTAAVGKSVMLFPGFQFNFDIGQVVPDGQGGDVEFTSKGVLKPIGDARIYVLNGSQLPPPAAGARPHDPLDHEGVIPRDFAGTWRVSTDGRWNGTWEITVDDEGTVRGQFVSDDTQSSYPISGKTSGLPHHAHLNVTFANSTLGIEAYLWTKDKSALAGTATLAGREFGFYALRQPHNAPEK